MKSYISLAICKRGDPSTSSRSICNYCMTHAYTSLSTALGTYYMFCHFWSNCYFQSSLFQCTSRCFAWTIIEILISWCQDEALGCEMRDFSPSHAWGHDCTYLVVTLWHPDSLGSVILRTKVVWPCAYLLTGERHSSNPSVFTSFCAAVLLVIDGHFSSWNPLFIADF